MKLTYFLRGLGVGILLAALALCISYRSNPGESTDVVEQAKKLGMVFPKGTQEPPTVSILPTETVSATPVPTIQPTISAVGSGAGVTGEETAQPPQQTQQPVQPTTVPTEAAPPATEKVADSGKKPDSSGKKFTVRGGLTSTTVAREMEEAGIIDSAEAMDEYMEKNGFSRKIRAGVYTIPKGASYAQIARIITKQG